MPLEFALRPRFDLNRPPKRRRFSGLEVHPLVLPIAAYWLAAAGGAYALLRTRAADAADETRQEAMSDSSRIADAVASDAPPRWSADSETSSELSGIAAVPTSMAPEPVPIATPQVEVPPAKAVMDAAPTATAHDRAVTLPREAPRLARNEPAAPPRQDPFESLQEPAPRDDEIPSRALGAETPRREAPPTALPSCEGAADTANQTIDLGAGRGAPDLTRDAFAAVLENGSYLSPCAVPARTAIEVCAAVQNGHVIGVTVTTEPRDPAINACVRRAVAGLRFPRNSALDVTRTRFESTR
jgi:hypothetical protein